jgi:predicted phosphodiesterase
MTELTKIYKNSPHLKIDDKSKIVIMSDCHRGTGDNHDNFLKNRIIYEQALKYYYNNEFTYIELGDGDDMWEVKNYEDIITENTKIFKQLEKFKAKNSLIMIYGNHDMIKKSSNIYSGNTTLFDDLTIYESLILDYSNLNIFLIHGHQLSLFNNKLWHVTRFLVRNIWRRLENLGIKDPTGSAKNYKVSTIIEQKLKKWSIKNNKIIIAGHTHRPIFPKIGESLYFNDGSCIHPNGITCIEIENGNITLIKWQYDLSNNDFITIKKEKITDSVDIKKFYLSKTT